MKSKTLTPLNLSLNLKVCIFFGFLLCSHFSFSEKVEFESCKITLSDNYFLMGSTKKDKTFVDVQNRIHFTYRNYHLEIKNIANIIEKKYFDFNGLKVKRFEWGDLDRNDFYLVYDNSNYLNIKSDDEAYVLSFLSNCHID